MSNRNRSELDIARRKIFIGGLSYSTDDDKLRSYFSKYGTVHDAVVMKDPVSCRSRGFGFITFEDIESVDSVLDSEPHTLDSRKVEAKRAVPKSDTNDGSGSGGSSNTASSKQSSGNNKVNSSANSSPGTKVKPASTSQSSNSASGSTTTSASTGSSSGSSNSVSSSDHTRSPSTNSSSGFEDVNGYCKIFVGGLHYDTRDADFRGYFEKYGKVQHAEVMFNRETHKSRGFGFIIFESEDSVDAVCDVGEHVIDAKVVEVKRAIPRSKFPGQGSGNGNSGNSSSGQNVGSNTTTSSGKSAQAKSNTPTNIRAIGQKAPSKPPTLATKIIPVSATTPLSNPASSWAALVKRSEPVPGKSDSNDEDSGKPSLSTYSPGVSVSTSSPASVHTSPGASNSAGSTISSFDNDRNERFRSSSEGGPGNHSSQSHVFKGSGYSSDPNLLSRQRQQPQSQIVENGKTQIDLSPQQQQQMMSARSPPTQHFGTSPSNSSAVPGYAHVPPPMMSLPPMQQQIQTDSNIFGATAGHLNPAAVAFDRPMSFQGLAGYPQEASAVTLPGFPAKSSDLAANAPSWGGVNGLNYPPAPGQIWGDPIFSQQQQPVQQSQFFPGNNSSSSNSELDDILMMQNINSLNILDSNESETEGRSKFGF